MRSIKSPNAFKTCYIAEAKEELGLLRKRNRNRKIRAPLRIKEIIKEAIKRCGPSATYREIQEKSLEVYKERNEEGVLARLRELQGSIKADSGLVRKIAQDEEIPYAD